MSEQRHLARDLKAMEAVKASLLELTDDEDTIRDTLEGETDLEGFVRKLMLSIDEDQLILDGIAARVSDLKEREDRYKKSIEWKRTLILQGMQVAEQQTFTLDIATISRRKPPAQLFISDESKLPAKYWVPSDPRLSKSDLKADLKPFKDDDGKLVTPVIDGAHLEDGPEGLTVRRK
ncbi:MAG: siphovirus Gp157 family protein [Pseudomonadota bacterium]